MFDLTLDELRENRQEHTAATSCVSILKETLLSGEYRDEDGEGRIELRLKG